MSKSKSKRKVLLRSFFYWARFLHIYTSALLFALLIFFCVTGYFLNHLDMFSGKSEDNAVELVIPESVSAKLKTDAEELSADNFDINPLKQWLKSAHGLSKLDSVDYDFEMGEVVLNYSVPAGYASAIFETESYALLLEYRSGDAIAIMNDLHKGRHSGAVWSWVIDVSAFLIIFFAITGYAILFQNKKHRRLAFILSVAGLISPLILYFFLVPRILGV